MIKARIEKTPILGRRLMTTENIKKGDIVVEETPFAKGPKQNSGIVCLGCYCPLQYDDHTDNLSGRCKTCHWPLCIDCTESIDHTAECSIFSYANVRFYGNVTESGICVQLDCITPLRVLLTKEADPMRWNKEVACMEYHDKERRKNTDIWNADLVNIAKYLRGPCKLSKRFSEDLIMQVIGILQVNAFEARTLGGNSFRCLYPITGILAHNCVPNIMRSIYPSENYKIRLRAMVNLEIDEQLQHSYTYTLDGTASRQNHLKMGKYFICECSRCKDPTELNTNFSAFKCTKCDDGWLLWLNPLDPLTEWHCAKCGFSTTNTVIQNAVLVMQSEISNMQSMDLNKERLEKAEKLLKNYSNVLHPSHFLQVTLYENLIKMYGRVQGYAIIELSDALLKQKEGLCRHVLKLLNVFEPGLSRMKAMILYELHMPIVLLAQRSFAAGLLAKDLLKQKLYESIHILKECVNILQYEDTHSPEGALHVIATQGIKQLEQYVISVSS